MKIAIFGGAGTIGGNQILVKTGKAAFWLDMGPPGLYEFNFFERQMFRSRTAEELGKRGMLPIRELKATASEGAINLLISHAHIDHYGGLQYHKAWLELGLQARLFAPDDLRTVLFATIKASNLPRAIINEILTPYSLDEAEAWNFKVTAIPVDHSIDSAYAYLCETDEGMIAYTGDLRFHEKSVDELAKKIAGVDVLVTEATRTVNYSPITEGDVGREVSKLIQIYKMPIFIMGLKTYTKNVKTIISAVGKSRFIVVEPSIAYELFASDPSLVDSLYVLKTGKDIERELPDDTKYYTIQEINDNHDVVALILRSIDRTLLIRGRTRSAIGVRDGDVAIANVSEAYDEVSVASIWQLNDYFNNELGIPIYHLHPSGHARIDEIKQLIETAQPKMTIVVHSKYPKVLQKLVKARVEAPTEPTTIEF